MGGNLMGGKVKVNEVRFGLFRISWNYHSATVPGVKYFQEFRTQDGRQFKISAMGSRSVHHSNLQWTYTLEYSKDSSSQSENQQPESKRQKLEEDSDSEKLKTQPPFQIGYFDETKFRGGKYHFSTGVSQNGFILLEFFIDFGSNEVNERNFINGISGIFHNQTLCDVKFKFKNSQEIGAHTVILSVGSPVFAAMFQSNFVESKSRVVNISDFEIEIFKEMLICLYTNKAPKLTEMNFTQSLYEVADKYSVEFLKNDCLKILPTLLSTNNAMELLVWAEFHSVLKLFEKVKKFLLQNCQEVCAKAEWLDFMKGHPELCFQIVKEITERPGTCEYCCLCEYCCGYESNLETDLDSVSCKFDEF